MRALLIIDMLNDFRDGALPNPRMERIIYPIHALAARFRAVSLPVIYCCDRHLPFDPEIALWGKHAMLNTPGSSIISELASCPGDYVIAKRTYDAFYSTKLAPTLYLLGVDELVLTGVLTNVCIQHTAAEAFYRSLKTIVPRDCVQALDGEAHHSGLKTMHALYDTEITMADQINLERR